MSEKSQHKRRRTDQSRDGNPARRQLEFDVVRNQVKSNKARFIARLQRIVQPAGECLIATCTKDHNGYPRMNIWYQGRPHTIHVMRVFLLLKRREPIPLGQEAAHEDECQHPRVCVKHVRLQHYSKNANTYHKRRKGDV